MKKQLVAWLLQKGGACWGGVWCAWWGMVEWGVACEVWWSEVWRCGTIEKEGTPTLQTKQTQGWNSKNSYYVGENKVHPWKGVFIVSFFFSFLLILSQTPAAPHDSKSLLWPNTLMHKLDSLVPSTINHQPSITNHQLLSPIFRKLLQFVCISFVFLGFAPI